MALTLKGIREDHWEPSVHKPAPPSQEGEQRFLLLCLGGVSDNCRWQHGNHFQEIRRDLGAGSIAEESPGKWVLIPALSAQAAELNSFRPPFWISPEASSNHPTSNPFPWGSDSTGLRWGPGIRPFIKHQVILTILQLCINCDAHDSEEHGY